MTKPSLGRLLVVDDDSEFLTPFCEVLSKIGYETAGFTSGKEALEALKEQTSDVILIDLVMPGMGGIETMKELRRIDPDIPVIIVTAHGDIPTAVEAIKLGAYDFMVKPPDYRLLNLTIERALDKKELTREMNRVQENWRETIKELQREISQRKQAEEEIKKLNEELEGRVIERTLELEGVNKKLESEITERKHAEEKIRIYQEQLRSLVSELSSMEERERRRIATDLHDHISQTLALAKIKLGALKESAPSENFVRHMEEISALIDQSIQYARSLTSELSPPVLYEFGLEAGVQWLVEQMQKQHGIKIDFETDKKPKPMGDETQILLFKVVRELLINIVKHAQAHRADVSIQRNGDSIRVVVRDDGIGFDVAKIKVAEFCFGLFNIRERLESIGGCIEINSGSGHGTCVTVSLPLNHKNGVERTA